MEHLRELKLVHYWASWKDDLWEQKWGEQTDYRSVAWMDPLKERYWEILIYWWDVGW